MPSTFTTRRLFLIAAAALLIGVAAFIVVEMRSTSPTDPTSSPAPTLAERFPGLDLEDPAASYQTLRYAAATGGDPRTRQMAIRWLDDQSRSNRALTPNQEKWLLTQIEDGAHPDWDIEYRLWLYNSAFNCLQRSTDIECFARLLQTLATEHPHRRMQLYALQHIGLLRENGRLTGPLAEEIHRDLEKLIDQPGHPVAGTAIALLIDWSDAEPPANTIEHALKLAADPAVPVDVRVTALHAADHAALGLARELSRDTDQPIILRKAAIASLGRYGDRSDTPALEQFAAEHFRLAQAAKPALKAIDRRLTNPTPPDLTPF